MSWWTTVLGGALGFMIGGPLGAMLGVAFAGNLSKGKSNFGGSRFYDWWAARCDAWCGIRG